MNNNKNVDVIIIGNDHSNTLGVIRTFGENKISPYVYVISDNFNVSISKSKYIKNIKIFNDEEIAIAEILKDFKDKHVKSFLIPTSDKAAVTIDRYYNKLSNYFFTQNINNKENMLDKYMDKFNQYKIAKKHGIKVAKSSYIQKPFDISYIKKEFNYPIIIKPLLSIDGKKEDIQVVNNEIQLNNVLNFYNINEYNRLLIQEFLEFDYECDMSGYCYDKKVCIAGFIRKIRIWPPKKGSLTFGKVEKYNKFKNMLDKLKEIFIELNYCGMFDVEFFVKGNNIFLNEINFRNSGLTYLYENSYLCYYYYISCINEKYIEAPSILEEYYVMDEQAELHQIIDKNINIFRHIKDKRKSKILLVSNSNDQKPARAMLIKKIKRNLRRKNANR